MDKTDIQEARDLLNDVQTQVNGIKGTITAYLHLGCCHKTFSSLKELKDWQTEKGK